MSYLYFIHFDIEGNTLVFFSWEKSQFAFMLISLLRIRVFGEAELRLEFHLFS